MSRFMNPAYDELEAYTPGEQPQERPYIKLNTNESPYPPAPSVVAAVGQAEMEQLRLYSDPQCARLRKALGENYGVPSDCVFVTNGSDDALNFAFMAFGADGALFADITYGFYPVFAALNHIPYREIPLKEDFSMDVDRFMGAEQLIVLANPNAPTGKALPKATIEQIVRSNPDHVVVVDEAYVDFGGESCVELTKKYENVLVVMTYSKSRSMAGARLGFAIGCKALIADLEKLRYSTNPYNINRLTLLAGEAALGAADYYKDCCDKIKKTRAWTEEELKKRGFTMPGSSANFLFAKSEKIDGGELYQKLREKGILIRHFTRPEIAQYNRITIGTPEQMAAMIAAVDEILKGE